MHPRRGGGFLNKENLNKIYKYVKKSIRWGISSDKLYQDFLTTFHTSDVKLFKNILTNNDHTLNHLLPPITTHSYNLRARPHNRQITMSTNLFQKTFFGRMLHFDSY